MGCGKSSSVIGGKPLLPRHIPPATRQAIKDIYAEVYQEKKPFSVSLNDKFQLSLSGDNEKDKLFIGKLIHSIQELL